MAEFIELTIDKPSAIELTLMQPGAPVPAEFAPVLIGAPLRMVTTEPLLVVNGQATLPSFPLGDLVLNMALIYMDLSAPDFDSDGTLLYDRDYLIEERVAMADGTTVVFPGTPPPDGHHAVVSYLIVVPRNA